MSKRKEQWAQEAVRQMRFVFDRAAVKQELLNHLEDRQQDYLDRGSPETEAEELALTAMGDPVETGKLLNEAHSPILGWAWLLSSILCGLLALSLVVWVGLDGGIGYYTEKVKNALIMDDPCMMTQWYEEQDVPYTMMEDTVTLELGDYIMELDHSFYAVDEYSYTLYLGWQVRAWKPWLEFPKGLYAMTVEDSFGNVFCDTSQRQEGKPDAEFYFNTTGAFLPVWRFHVELLYMPHYEAYGVPEWLKFSIPGTNAEFTVYLDGEVRS